MTRKPYRENKTQVPLAVTLPVMSQEELEVGHRVEMAMRYALSAALFGTDGYTDTWASNVELAASSIRHTEEGTQDRPKEDVRKIFKYLQARAVMNQVLIAEIADVVSDWDLEGSE